MAVATVALTGCAGCGGCGGDRSRGAPASAAARGEGSAAGGASPSGAGLRPTERTALEAVPAPPPEPSGPPERVRLTASDGVGLVGTLRLAPGAPAVLLVHQLGSTRAEWDPLVAALSEAPGLTTLALDLRGHGESIEGPGGARLDHTAFTQTQWAELVRDVRAGLEFLRSHPSAQPPRIALVGSSIGATAVLTEAADAPDVDRVVALSPGRAYHGLDGVTPVTRLGGRRLLVVSARGDAFSFETAEVLTQLAPAVEFREAPGSAHGVAMFASDAAARDRVVAFLREDAR